MATPVNTPQEIDVTIDVRGEPTAIVQRTGNRRIFSVRNRWRIDDEWWRKEISRIYYEVLLSDGSLDTIFEDAITGKWYRQR